MPSSATQPAHTAVLVFVFIAVPPVRSLPARVRGANAPPSPSNPEGSGKLRVPPRFSPKGACAESGRLSECGRPHRAAGEAAAPVLGTAGPPSPALQHFTALSP